MGKRWYGSVNNRIEENRQFCDEIKVGTGVTEYFYSDREAYEVIAVEDQKHVTIRLYDHKNVGGAYSNNWELISNEKNPTVDLVKRGKYWYSVSVCTPETAKEFLAKGKDLELENVMWVFHNGFDLEEIANSGKTKKKYHRMNVSFGVANYYYDYEF